MTEWSVPQYSAQYSSYSPGLVGSNQSVVYRPGSTSALRRNAGTKKLWITSCEIIVSFPGRPIGTWSPPISDWPSGYSVFHIHCRATTYTSSALGGGVAASRYSFAPHPNGIIASARGT